MTKETKTAEKQIGVKTRKVARTAKAHRHGPRKQGHRTAGLMQNSGVSYSRLWMRNLRDLQAAFDRRFVSCAKEQERMAKHDPHNASTVYILYVNRVAAMNL